jgi:nitrogen regulatory protein P-II 1
MSAARESGAKGGTVIGARGTGNDEVEKFYGVVIKPDKEMVLILVSESKKEKILEVVGKEAGLNTKGQGIAFALPVTDSVGLVQEDATPSK